MLLASLIASLSLLASAQSAHAYDYNLSLYPATWGSRYVAHNYSYIRMSTPSGSMYICVKLTRTSDGTNYGDVYCNNNQTGHHYAGDTGTYSWGKHDGFTTWSLPYHEEW